MPGQAIGRYVGEGYIQHNPHVANKKLALIVCSLCFDQAQCLLPLSVSKSDPTRPGAERYLLQNVDVAVESGSGKHGVLQKPDTHRHGVQGMCIVKWPDENQRRVFTQRYIYGQSILVIVYDGLLQS